MTEFIFVRHAHSVMNTTRTYNWNPAKDPGIDEKGSLQARLLASSLSRKKIEAIYSSPFPRCLQTAKPIAQAHSLKISADERLFEHRTGHWEGLTKEQVLQQYGDEKKAELADRMRYTISGGGENYEQIIARALSFVREKARQYEGTLVAVTHDAVIRCALTGVFNDVRFLDRTPGFVENASATSFEFNGTDKPKLIAFNDTKHLNESGEK